MSAGKKDDLTSYHQFRAAIGVTTKELQELFAREVKGLTQEELRILKDSDFYKPKTWTKEQERIYIKMLARAAVKRNGRAGAGRDEHFLFVSMI